MQLNLSALTAIVIAAGTIGTTLLGPTAYAQDSAAPGTSTTVLTTEGVVGDIDKHRRGPQLSVSTEVGENVVQILADASMPNSQFAKYPLQFDFFINRRLFSSQVRSIELPGPIGVDVGSDIATPPFNYTVVAKVLHPNSVYTTVIQGAVYANDYTTTFTECTLTTVVTSDDLDLDDVTTIYSAEDVLMNQVSNGNVSMSFSAASSDASTKVDSSLAISGSEVSGTITTSSLGVLDVAGLVTLPAGTTTVQGVTSLNVESVDGAVALKCS